jgi:hypothetical protein
MLNPRHPTSQSPYPPKTQTDELADRIFAVGNRSQAANLAIRIGYFYSHRFGIDI